MPKSPGVVIGGSPRFVNAVIAPLADKVGVWPDIAPDPQQVMFLCDGAWLAVLEMQDDEWLTLVHDLRSAHGRALGIVVARPAGSTAAPLPDADEQVSWDGTAAPLLESIQRLADQLRPVAPAPPPPAPVEETPLPEGEEPPAEAAAPASGAAQGNRSSDIWPGTVSSRSEGESVLQGAVADLWPEEAFRPLAERVVRSLSDLEKAALREEPIPVAPGPIRRAAGLRWVVTEALERAPAPGSPVDGAAVQAILGEIDDALAELKGAGEGAAPEVQPALGALRHVLVKEAIDLTDAVHRIVPSQVPAKRAPPPPAAPAREKQAAPRTITFGSPSGRRPGVQRALWVALAITALAGAVFHGWNLLARKPPPPSLPARTAAPAVPPGHP